MPVSVDTSTPSIENSIGQSSSTPRSTARVLILDDDPGTCEFLVSALSHAGFACATAPRVEASLPLSSANHPDAVIASLHLPESADRDLLAAIRHRCPHSAILVILSAGDALARLCAMNAGADDSLVKPLHEELVIASLRRALQARALEHEVTSYRLRLDEIVASRTGQAGAAFGQLESSFQQTLEAIAAAIDLRDSSDAGHSRRVCRYSLEIAKVLGLSAADLKSLFMGACLHDIGKLALPDGILLKPGAFTPEERTLMQQHVQTGYDLVKQIPFLAGAAELILTHHERYDGSGYPRGLQAGQIPVGSRIFAVADTLDAITSDRPYRRARSFDAALRVIRSNSARLYDPQLVAVFLTIPKETWLAISRNQRQLSTLPAWLRAHMPANSLLRPFASLVSTPPQ